MKVSYSINTLFRVFNTLTLSGCHGRRLDRIRPHLTELDLVRFLVLSFICPIAAAHHSLSSACAACARKLSARAYRMIGGAGAMSGLLPAGVTPCARDGLALRGRVVMSSGCPLRGDDTTA